MSDPQKAAEDGARTIAAAVGVQVTDQEVTAIAGAFLGILQLATNAGWKHAQQAGADAAAKVDSVAAAVEVFNSKEPT